MGVPGDTCTFSPDSLSVFGTCSARSSPSRSQGLSAAMGSISSVETSSVEYGLKERALQDAIDVHVAVPNRHVPADARRFETAAQMQTGVDFNAAVLVVDHFEVAAGCIDLQVADLQLVRCDAAVHVQRMAVRILDVQMVHGDAIRAKRKTACAFLYVEPVAVVRNPASDTSTRPSKCGSRLVPMAFTSSLNVPRTLVTTSVSPSTSARLIGLESTATSIGCSGRFASKSDLGTVPFAVSQTPGASSTRKSIAKLPLE